MSKISRLFYKLFTGHITESERAEIERWGAESPDQSELAARLSNPDVLHEEYMLRSIVDSDRAERDMQRRIRRFNTPLRRRRMIAIAASVALIFAIGMVAIFNRPVELKNGNENIARVQPITIDDIRPGKPKATITDGLGKTLVLSEADTMKPLTELFIVPADNQQVQAAVGLCLDVPRGGEFKIVLEDSTEVWLNSESQLRYPEHFADGERRVQVSGEVYFSVRHDSRRPFYVEAAGQLIQVYGTSFNVKAYGDEPIVYTTLEQGSVSIRQMSGEGGELHLSPGHQARFDRDNSCIDMKVVDPEVITSWRHGKFVFEEQPLGNIMRDLSRWYDFEYEFTDSSIESLVFMGSIPRYTDFRTVIGILQDGGELHFATDGNKVIVSRK